MKCPHCDGKGVRTPTTYPENRFGKKTCSFCKGTGKIQKEEKENL